MLDVQEIDSRIALLLYRLGNVPETAQIVALKQERTVLDNRLRDARIVVDDLTVEQKRADRDVEQVKTRRKRDLDRIDQGLITSPKDLARMQHELDSLERRISNLEDAELEVMEQLEAAQGVVDALTAELATLDERLAALAVSRDEKASGLEEELRSLEAARGPAVEGLPEDLLALYDRLRAQRGGVGAAALRARQCTGCRLTLDNKELAVIAAAPSDRVIRCEECTRILVRNSESGL